MYGPTRNARRHRGIRTTHPPYDVTNSPAALRAVQAHLRAHGVRQFLADAVRGDLQTPAMTIPRASLLSMVDHKPELRGQISRLWRQEDPHHHEWIPCTYLCHIVSRAIEAQDFRYILLADAMRSPTQSLIFTPVVNDVRRVVVSNVHRVRASRVVLHAHPGGLRFRAAPHGVYAGQVTRFMPGQFLTESSAEMHDAIIRVLLRHGSPAAMVNRLHGVFQQYCWNGVFPVHGWTAATMWKYYRRGDGTEITHANFAAFIHAIQVDYADINHNFTVTWPGIANGHGRQAPQHW